MEKKRYGAIDGLRMIAAFGIVMMHMRANNNYEISGYVYNTIIPSFTDFVFLFMTVSAFGMCCGYYGKVLGNQISFSEFYGKRFKRVLPFFATLVLLDIIVSPSVTSLYEGFADLTLLFGFLPNAGNISVIGVGWFLGLVFVFYLIFPFFCVLLENKRRAWMALAVSLLYNFVCASYFEVGRTNILYSACFFVAGGLVYLYQNELARLNQCSVNFLKKVTFNTIVARNIIYLTRIIKKRSENDSEKMILNVILVNAFNCRFQIWIADAFTRYTVQTAINYVCGYNYMKYLGDLD